MATAMLATNVSAGSRVAGGTPGADQVYIQHLSNLYLAEKKKLGAHFDQHDWYSSWCGFSHKVLKNNLDRARKLVSKSKYKAAQEKLVSALVAASQSFSDIEIETPPKLKLMIDHTLVIYNSLQGQIKVHPMRVDPNFIYTYLAEYTQLILDTDQGYSFGSHHHPKKCTGCDHHFHQKSHHHASFVSTLVTQARRQLEFVVDNFSAVNNFGDYVYRGRPDGYLKIVELVSKFAADDLEFTMDHGILQCQIDTLRELNINVHGFLEHHRRDEYSTWREAVNDVTEEIRAIIKDMNC